MLICEPALGQISEGVWVGSLGRTGGPPTATRFDVAVVDNAITITLHVPGARKVHVEELRLTEGELSFSWTPSLSRYECQLSGDGHSGYEGTCVSAEGTHIGIRLMPPGTTPIGLARHALQHSDYQWFHHASDHLDLYSLPGTYPHDRRDFLAYDAEQARANALRIIGERDYQGRISFFYLESREDTRALFGQPAWGRADPLGDAVVLAWNQERTLFQRHEIMHVLSWGVWGIASLPNGWISEGLAVFAQGRCRGYDLHELTRSLDQSDSLLQIDSLVNHFWEQEEVLAYVQAGSVVRYIHEVWGAEVLRRLWQLGVSQVVELTGLTLAQLDADWRQHIADVSESDEAIDWKPADGC